MAVLNRLVELDDLLKEKAEAVAAVAGGKGYGLWTLARLGLPYPATWVVPPDLLAEFKLKYPAGGNDELLLDAQAFLAGRLLSAVMQLPDCLYAVRSSAGVEDAADRSFAGMFESLLNVTRAEIPTAVASVWGSCFGRRVGSYFAGADSAAMAVLVQPMVAARLSGVCFSVNPSPGSVAENESFLVEIVTGSGEKLVQGETTPLRLSGSFAALSSCSDYPWLTELLLAVMRLQAEQGTPVDVEFAIDEAGKLWLLQQRPVTRVNLNNVLNLAGYRKAYKRALCSLDIEFLIDGCVKYLPAYLEVPVSLERWMVMLTNENDGQQELWLSEHLDEAVVSLVCSRIEADKEYLSRMRARYAHHHRRILSWQATGWADSSLPLGERVADFFEYIGPVNANYYAPMHIIEALSALLLRVMRGIDSERADDDFFAIATDNVSSLGQIFAGECARLGQKFREQLGDVPQSLSDVPEQLAGCLEDLAERYGFLQCHQPYEEPYAADDVLRLVCEGETAAGGEERGAALAEAVYRQDARWQELAAQLHYWLDVRNQKMEYLYFVYAKAASLFDRLGAALGLAREQVWKLDKATIIASLQGEPALCCAGKRQLPAIYYDGRQVVVRDKLKILQSDGVSGTEALKGKTVYGSGIISGVVKLAFTPDQLTEIREKVIVVTGMTTPDFVPLMVKKAAALITDEGGILCHAAIIAREMKLPCIVGTGVATETLRDGMAVVLDLDRGIVRCADELT